MPEPTIGTLAFNEACQRIIVAARQAKPGASIQYAATYAKAGLQMTDRETIRVQCLYILNNLSGWRGEEAKQVKATLIEFSK